jgi:DNA-binding Xre family transcriptional regulator
MTVATREPLKSSNPGKARKMSRRTNLKGKEVRGMNDEKTERSRRVATIKETAKSTNGGRSYLLKGLWACRLAAGLDQRQLAQAMGSSQATVGQLERGDRGAYPKTIMRLCECLEVAPEDLLSGDSPSEPKKSVDRIRR